MVTFPIHSRKYHFPDPKRLYLKQLQEQVLEADEIFITNSLRGIWPVIQLEATQFPIGKFTKMLQRHSQAWTFS